MAGIFSSKGESDNLQLLTKKGQAFKAGNEYQTEADLITYTAPPYDGSNGKWTTQDRENNTPRWQVIVRLITIQKPKGYLKPFDQILSYYRSVDKLLYCKGHRLNWLNGAIYLVEELNRIKNIIESAVIVQSGFNVYILKSLSGDFPIPSPYTILPNLQNLQNLLEELNEAICNYAITKFHDLLYGIDQLPLKIGKIEYEYTREFIEVEQCEKAFLIYKKYNDNFPSTMIIYNDLFHKENFFSLFKDNNSLSQLTKPIPVFRRLYNSDLINNTDILLGTTTYPTSPKTFFGQEARVQVPLLMLYNLYFRNDNTNNLANDLYVGNYKDTKAAKILRREYLDNDVIVAYNSVRAKIKPYKEN